MSTIARPPCDEAAILSTPCSKPSGTDGKWVLAATILGSSMAFIDGTVVNVSLPALQNTFHASGTDIQWVVEAYALFLAALLLVGGALGDLYGRRKIFVCGVTLFAAASAWCGLATSVHQLIAARAIQGLGGALLVPGSLALISASFPAEERGRAIGTWSGFTAITAAAGPVLGGWLVQHASWRWVFFLNLPLAIAVVLISIWHVPESRNPGSQSSGTLDWPGAVLVTAGLGGVTFALIESARNSAAVRIAALAGMAALAAFVGVESRSRNPMLSLTLFANRNFSGANLLTLFLYAGLGGVFFFLPLNLIQVQHYPATEAGAALLPFILLMFLLSRWSGGLVQSYGARAPLVTGPVIASVGFALLSRPGLGGSYWTTVFPGVLVLGFGMAISVAPLTTVVMNSAGQEHAGSASGINNAVSRVSSLLAIALFGLVFFRVFDQSLQRHVNSSGLPRTVQAEILAQSSKLAAIETSEPAGRIAVEQSFVDGYRSILWIAAALALASSASAALMIRRESNPASESSPI